MVIKPPSEYLAADGLLGEKWSKCSVLLPKLIEEGLALNPALVNKSLNMGGTNWLRIFRVKMSSAPCLACVALNLQ